MIPAALVCLVLILGSTQASWNVTCDLDLDNIQEIVQYLPDECKEIYAKGSASELYKRSVLESKKFQEFFDTLEAYERKATSPPEGEVPEQDWEFRNQIYNATILNDCSVKIANNSESLSDSEKIIAFYDCLLAKREEMISLMSA